MSDYLTIAETKHAKEFRKKYRHKIKINGFINPDSCFGDVWYKVTKYFMYDKNPYWDSVYYWNNKRNEEMSLRTYDIRKYRNRLPKNARIC